MAAVKPLQLKPLVQASLQEAARLGASKVRVQQLDVDEVLARCLALALIAFPNFHALRLKELNVYDEAAAHLADALHSCEHLRTLCLDTMWASEDAWGALAAALKVNTSLATLKLRHCLAGAHLGPLRAALRDNRHLTRLEVAGPELGDAGLTQLCQALMHNVTLTRLSVCGVGAGAAAVPALLALLRGCPTLKALALARNTALGPEGCLALCRPLAYAPINGGLTLLDLTATGMDDAAADALARAAGSHGSSLAVLLLSHNRIGSRGATALAAAAKRPGCRLAEIDLSSNCDVGQAGAHAWAEVLSAQVGGSRLARLLLNDCEVTDAAVYALGAALKGNTTLRELGLAHNHVTTAGIALLAEVLKVNSTLRLLDVSCNMVGPRGMAPLTDLQHLSGHIAFSKARDHTLQRVSSCAVRAELLPEYRTVEQVKLGSGQHWEPGADNPFLNAQAFGLPPPPPSAAAADSFGGGASGAWGGGGGSAAAGAGANPLMGLGDTAAGSNPFDVPATPTNPFLVAPAAANPFAEESAPSNPFLGGGHELAEAAPAAVVASNPFASPGSSAAPHALPGADSSGLVGLPHDMMAAARALLASSGGGACGEELWKGLAEATRVVTRAPGSSSGAGGEGAGGSSCTGSVQVHSDMSSADTADLVTELDLRLIDRFLEQCVLPSGVGPDTHMGPSMPSYAAAPGIWAQAAAAADEVRPLGDVAAPAPMPAQESPFAAYAEDGLNPFGVGAGPAVAAALQEPFRDDVLAPTMDACTGSDLAENPWPVAQGGGQQAPGFPEAAIDNPFLQGMVQQSHGPSGTGMWHDEEVAAQHPDPRNPFC